MVRRDDPDDVLKKRLIFMKLKEDELLGFHWNCYFSEKYI